LLEIQEISEKSLSWIRPLFENDAVHIGDFPACLDSSKGFELIFLSAVDYSFNQKDWVDLLNNIRMQLTDNGRCLVVTPSFQGAGFFSLESVLGIKSVIKNLLSYFGVYDRGQLMGWRRTKGEFRDAMISAGFLILEEGFLDRDALQSHAYWIEGSLKRSEN
jgi:hypothetical protein